LPKGWGEEEKALGKCGRVGEQRERRGKERGKRGWVREEKRGRGERGSRRQLWFSFLKLINVSNLTHLR